MTILSLPPSSTICPIIIATWENLRPLRSTLKKALDIRRELLADHRDTIKSLFDLGVALKANKKFREAKHLLEECKTMHEKVVDDTTLEKK